MLFRLLVFLAVTATIFGLPSQAQASRICENLQVGTSPPPIIGYDSSNNNQPIYGVPQPIYEEHCTWKYGAVAVDPATRAYTAAWNYDDADVAKSYVVDHCGNHCAWISFGEDFGFIALSDDDQFSGYSTASSAEAQAQCMIAGGLECATVISASSTADTRYWHFGAIAYDAATGASAASWSHSRKGEAQKAAMTSCAAAGCWAYTFQTGFGGMALADDGTIFGGWSARDEESAGKVALKDCEKTKGKKSCSVVFTGNAETAPKFKPKIEKKKKKP